MKRLVVVPTLCEADTIASTLEQLVGLDVLVCDSGSPDGTAEIARSLGVKVLDCPPGYGVAIMAGFKYAHKNWYDQVIVMDSESHTYSEIAPYLDQPCDMIAGWRQSESKSLLRKFISKVGKKLVKSRVPSKLKDPSNGFRAYSRRLVGHILRQKWLLTTPPYAWNAAVAYCADEFTCYEFPMTYTGGQSGLTPRQIGRVAIWVAGQSERIDYNKEEPTLEEVVKFLRLCHGPNFDHFIRRHRG